MDMQNAAYWIKRLTLEPHAMGGGYYKVSFRSPRQVLDPVSGEARQASTSTYYVVLPIPCFIKTQKMRGGKIK